ncbi:MAG: hypothetical protein AAFX40_16160 [Cyanobacteria bacterium J06639_1]
MSRELLDKANQKLKNARVSLKAIRRSGDRLWLYVQGTFPPKPGSGKTKWHQQSIATGRQLTKIGVKSAIAIAQRIDAQLVEEMFDWKQWANVRSKDEKDFTAGDWVDSFKQD